MIGRSTLYMIDERFRFPKPDGYAEISGKYGMLGGEAANSAIVLSGLGVKTKIDGNWVGSAYRSDIIGMLSHYGIDCTRISVKDGYDGVEEIVFSDGATRTVFGSYIRLLFTEKQWNTPLRSDIEKADAVTIDPFFGDESETASRLCMESDKRYVTIDCRHDSPVASNAAVTILSREFLEREYRKTGPREVLKHYIRECTGLVIVTSGNDDILYCRTGTGIKNVKPYDITPHDTCGAGDAFRAGIVFGLLENMPDRHMIRFAAAVAAVICTSFPGVMHPPSCDDVLRFMRIH